MTHCPKRGHMVCSIGGTFSKHPTSRAALVSGETITTPMEYSYRYDAPEYHDCFADIHEAADAVHEW